MRGTGEESWVEMDVPAGKLNELRQILRGSGIRMRVVKRYGIVRMRWLARRRGALVAACAGVLMMVLYVSQTVLKVEVRGAKDAEQEMRMKAILTECGVVPGTYAGAVDKSGAAEEIMSREKGLTYAAVRRRGMGMELYVVQATERPEIYDAARAADVVAETGGLVTRVVVLSGEAMVRPGDTVVPGQVLIAGTEREPHARGTVTARVWAVGEGEAAMREETVERTGRIWTESFAEMGRWRFPKEKAGEFEEEEVERKEEWLLDGLFYPVKMVECEHYEVKSAIRERTIAQAKGESGARAMTNALLMLKNGVCVVDKRVEYCMIEDGKLRAVATLEGIMQIGVEKDAAETMQKNG